MRILRIIFAYLAGVLSWIAVFYVCYYYLIPERELYLHTHLWGMQYPNYMESLDVILYTLILLVGSLVTVWIHPDHKPSAALRLSILPILIAIFLTFMSIHYDFTTTHNHAFTTVRFYDYITLIITTFYLLSTILLIKQKP